MKVSSAMVRVPIREVVPAFGATTYITLPLPVPKLPELMVIHEVLVALVQVQLLLEFTITPPLPPIAGKDASRAERP